MNRGNRASNPAIAVIAATNYLAKARVLAQSLQTHHPDLSIYLLVIDDIAGRYDPSAEPFRLIRFHDLPLPHLELQRIAFAYGVRALASACKPLVLRKILDREHDRALLIDPDTLVSGSLDCVFKQLDNNPILLSPHRIAPSCKKNHEAIDLHFLRVGTFNAGFLAVRNHPAARRFLAWWWARLRSHCRGRVERGLHFDQRWLDLVPGLFDEVGIMRDPRLNVAYWNLEQRWPSDSPERPGAGVRDHWLSFHFSGFDHRRTGAISAFAPQIECSAFPGLEALVDTYRDRLIAAGQLIFERWDYGFGFFDNGVPIPDIVRDIFLELEDSTAVFGDPFTTDPAGSFFRWLGRSPEGEGLQNALPEISNLWFQIYLRRPDVQSEYPEIDGSDRERFREWTLRSGHAEHSIPECFRIA